MSTTVVSETLDPNVQLEQVFSHPGISFDEEKGLLELNGEAIAALVQLIEETKKTIVSSIPTLDESAGTETVSRDATLQESAPSPNNLPTLIDQGITSEALSITKKGKVRGAVGKIYSRWKNGKTIDTQQFEKVTEKIGPSVPSINIWIKIGDRMLPAPIMIWSGSTFETVRVGLEVRLRYSGIFTKKK